MVSKSFDITEDVVNYLSHPPTQQSIYKNTGMLYDFAVNGNPFLIATGDEHPYTRAFAQMKKDQIDQSLNPGEQSLTMWWTRNQSDFSGGAGIKFYEPVSDERVMRSYVSSVGIDPWNIGEISLLNSMTANTSIGQYVDIVNIDGTEKLVALNSAGTSIQVYTIGTNGSLTTSGTAITSATGLLGLIAVNDRFVVWNSRNIYVSNTNGTSITAIYDNKTNHTIKKVFWVKQRFVVWQTDANNKQNLTECPFVTTSQGSISGTEFASNSNPNWVWTAMVESPQAIIGAGYAGHNSAIYKFTLVETSTNAGTVLSTSAPTVAAELPTNEKILSMASYLGTFIGIGTNRGMRVGIIDDYGNLTYGQLLFQTTGGVVSVVPGDSYFWCLTSNGVDGKHGCYRVNLSDQETNTYMRVVLSYYAWATDVYADDTANLAGVVKKLSDGRTLFSTTGNKVYVESSTKLASGTITMGQIRYNTYENKLFKKVSIKGLFPSGTRADIISIKADETTYPMYTIGQEETIDVSPREPLTSLGFKVVLYSNATTNTGPTIRGFQVKSLPAVPRQQNIQFSLFCFDYESDMHGNKAGGVGKALKRFGELVEDTRLGDIVLFQDFHTGENLYGIVEELEFNQVAPPRPNTSGFGGIVTIRIKTVY